MGDPRPRLSLQPVLDVEAPAIYDLASGMLAAGIGISTNSDGLVTLK